VLWREMKGLTKKIIKKRLILFSRGRRYRNYTREHIEIEKNTEK